MAARTLVITGAASGFGLEFARLAAQRGDNVVMADVEAAALDRAAAEIAASGVAVLAQCVDVSRADQVAALAAATEARFGAPHWVFNNAGVGAGGLLWEHTIEDWSWLLGVNLMGVVHGVRAFTPLMLARAAAEPDYRGCIINTASMAGLLSAPLMGVYNVSKHAVVTLTETLYQDLKLVTPQLCAAVLCPYFVPTGISQSERNRPGQFANATPRTLSQQVAQMQSEKAVASGKVSAATLAARVFAELEEGRFYLFSHPHALGNVATRMQDIIEQRNPTDPFAERPEIGAALRARLSGGDR
ncbi:MAG: SDR family oxidoreductase [Burkholderiales bacterium]|nr:SDR family oxidoreductase [Burkholderiales bacterium]MCZ2134934.1 SDR family oxidoreductase [Burkholderiales bacterium]